MIAAILFSCPSSRPGHVPAWTPNQQVVLHWSGSRYLLPIQSLQSTLALTASAICIYHYASSTCPRKYFFRFGQGDRQNLHFAEISPHSPTEVPHWINSKTFSGLQQLPQLPQTETLLKRLTSVEALLLDFQGWIALTTF